MSTDKGCAPGKSSLIGLGSARDYDGCVGSLLQVRAFFPSPNHLSHAMDFNQIIK